MKPRFDMLLPFAISLCVKQIIALTGQLSNQSEMSSSQDNSLGLKRIVCFLRDWAVDSGFDIENDIDPNICSHIIYAFAKFDDNGTIVFDDKFADHNEADYSRGKG